MQRLSWQELIERMADTDRIARLDGTSAILHSSYARNWSNDDFRNYEKPGPKGWQVMADLKGPGYVSRFWMTGPVKPHRIRLYFDDERTPRIDTTIQEFFGKAFAPPLSANENLCWYSLVPMPYAKRLVMMTEEGGDTPESQPKLFYQISEIRLPAGVAVETFPAKFSAEQEQALQRVAEKWDRLSTGLEAASPAARTQEVAVTLAPGESKTALDLPGPAILRQLRVSPDYARAGTPAAAETLLREIIVRVTWNGAGSPSVEAPLGDFCGNVWCHTSYLSAYFGSASNSLVNRFPMPFERAAAVSFVNQSSAPVTLGVSAVVDPLPAWDGAWGYLHAQWRRSGPVPDEKPHMIYGARGQGGKFVGCILAVSSLDRSWWMLEGDEHFFVDGEQSPSWNGTGLEDYFTGGWYYHNVLARPFHGLVFKVPFRTVQYRIQAGDPVSFNSALCMTIERGAENRTRGWMESLAFAYLRAPTPAGSELRTAAERSPPADAELAAATIMIELCNQERFGDYAGAMRHIDAFLERHPGYPYESALRLRQIAYREKLEGFPAVRSAYQAFAASCTNAAARFQAETLLWFHEDPSHAILGSYCNRPTRLYMDGAQVGETTNDGDLFIFRVNLTPGKHALALQTLFQQYPDWCLAYLRTHDKEIVTTDKWIWAFTPQGEWAKADFDDSSWIEAHGAVKGPPEEPWVWMSPNGMVDMQSKAKGVMKAKETPKGEGFVVYRKTFDIQ